MSAEENEEGTYGLYWEAHLQVYKQPLVWISNVLTTKEQQNGGFLNLLAVLAVSNCIIMFLAAFPIPILLLFGIILLLLALCLSFCVLTNLSHKFKLYQNWGEREEERYKSVCLYVGKIHLKINLLVKNVSLLRKEDPKKFYGIGILLSFLLSHLGSIMSTSIFLHITINGLLLVPLIFHYELHKHIITQDWKQLGITLQNTGRSVLEKLKKWSKKREAARIGTTDNVTTTTTTTTTTGLQ